MTFGYSSFSPTMQDYQQLSGDKCMDWQTYEEAVRDIYNELGKASRVRVVGYGNSCKVQGKSGVEHQIDVLTEHNDGIHTYKTAIECKFWQEKVQKDTVTKLADILEDAKIEKGVIVSKSGFTQDAVTFAKYKNISLVELRKPCNADWIGRVKDITVTLRIAFPHVSDFQIVQPSSPSGQAVTISALSTNMIFCSQGRRESAQQLIEQEVKRIDLHKGDLTPCEIRFPDGCELEVVGETVKAPVESVKFSIQGLLHDSVIEIHGEEYVSMIMRCIFEEKTFVIARDGKIRTADDRSIQM